MISGIADLVLQHHGQSPADGPRLFLLHHYNMQIIHLFAFRKSLTLPVGTMAQNKINHQCQDREVKKRERGGSSLRHQNNLLVQHEISLTGIV